MKTGVMVFQGKYLEELIKELDAWLVENNASLYGQGAIKQRKIADDSYEVILKYAID